MEYRQFQPGQKVRNQYGEIRTVSSQLGCHVFVEEERNGHYHPSKLFPIEQPTKTQEHQSEEKRVNAAQCSLMMTANKRSIYFGR